MAEKTWGSKFKKGLRSLVFEDSKEGAIEVSNVSAEIKNATTSPSFISSVPGVSDINFKKILLEALAEKNKTMPGIDFFEFFSVYSTAVGSSPQEKVKNTFAMLRAMDGNLEKPTLISTAAHYKSVLEHEKIGFETESVKFSETSVGAKEAEIQILETQNEALSKQILDIQNQIQQNFIRVNSLNGEVMNARLNIETQSANFNTTYLEFLKEIDGLLQTIETTL